MISKKLMDCELPYQQKPCKCGRGHRDDPIVAAAGCADDDAAVATLPEQWVPKHSGPILANYLKQRGENHEKVLQDLSNVADKLNESIHIKIRELAERLLTHIEQNQRDIDNVVEGCNLHDNDPPLTAEARNEALKKVHELHAQRIEDMAAFYRDALVVERERAEGLKKLLRDQFQRVIAVGHYPPKDLLHDFDDRIYEINQQLISNSRAYSELEMQLRAEADESVVKARSALNQLCLGVAIAPGRRSARPRPSKQLRFPKRSVSANDKRRDSSDPSLNKIIDATEIDQCVTRLADGYRVAVLKVLSGFFDKLSDLHKSLTRCSHLECRNNVENLELEGMLERAIIRLSSIKDKMPSLIPQYDEASLQQSLWSLGEHLRDTFNILHDAGYLWDPHMMRSALAQKLTMAAVEDLLTSNDAIEQAHELNFSVAFEQMRSSSEPEKVQQQYEALVVMLERIAGMYLQHSVLEIGKLEEYMNLPPIMANTLLAEFNCFLEKHPRTPVSTTFIMDPGAEVLTVQQDSQRHSQLPRAIRQTELQEIALTNWRNGFLEAFQNNVVLVPDELMRQARQWVDQRATVLHMRYSMKMMSHSVRLERLKAARDARLAELKHHESRLNSHINAVYELIDNLPLQASEFSGLDSPELFPISEWCNRIREQIQYVTSNPEVSPEVRKLKMNSYAPRLLKYRSLFEESLDKAIEEYKGKVEQSIQAARISNVRYVNQIKLLYERGRYSAQEAIYTTTAVLKSSEALETCDTKTFEALNHRRAHLIALANEILTPLQKVVEEYVKPVKGAKAAVAEKKKPPGKKK